MSSDEFKLSTPSDSSDDVGVLAQFAGQLRSRQTEPRRECNAVGAESASEPDWVRDFTPQKRNDADQKAALLAILDEDSDDESIINLVSQERNVEEKLPKETDQAAKEISDSQKTPTAAKRARAPTKPKSNLPLVAAPKMDDSLVLLQSAEGDLDLSGDVGAVGRVKLQEGALFLDIKGVLYRTNITPCNTVCVVTVGEDEARITSVLDEVVTLECERNLFACDETVVHGVLDDEMDGANFSQPDRGTQENEVKATGKKSMEMNGRAKSKGKSKFKATKATKGITKPPHRKS